MSLVGYPSCSLELLCIVCIVNKAQVMYLLYISAGSNFNINSIAQSFHFHLPLTFFKGSAVKCIFLLLISFRVRTLAPSHS